MPIPQLILLKDFKNGQFYSKHVKLDKKKNAVENNFPIAQLLLLVSMTRCDETVLHVCVCVCACKKSSHHFPDVSVTDMHTLFKL